MVTRIDQQDATNVDSKGIAFTIRSVFIIDPAKKIRLIMSYPASTGRNTAEVLRVLDSLQTGDRVSLKCHPSQGHQLNGLISIASCHYTH